MNSLQLSLPQAHRAERSRTTVRTVLSCLSGPDLSPWRRARDWGSVRLSQAALVARTQYPAPPALLRIEGLEDGEYFLRARIGLQPGTRLFYFYGYGSPDAAETHVLPGAMFKPPESPGLVWVPMANATVQGGALAIALGPVTVRGEASEDDLRAGRARQLNWYALRGGDAYGAWDRIELTPITPLPDEQGVDGGRYVSRRRSFQKVVTGPHVCLHVDVGGDAAPVMESLKLEAAGEAAQTPWLLAPDTPDYSSLDALVRSIVKPGMSAEEKAVAIFDFFCQPILYHTTRARERGRSFHDTLKTLNVYGYGWCMVHATCYYELARRAGLDVRVESCPSHKWNRVRLNGMWAHFDCDHALILRDPAGHIPTREYLFEHPEVVAQNGDEFWQTPKGLSVEFLRTCLPETCRMSRIDDEGHRMRFALRPGESFARSFAAEPLNVNYWKSSRQDLSPILGRGTLKLRLVAADAKARKLLARAVNLARRKNRFVQRRASRMARFELPVRTAYAIFGARVSMNASGTVSLKVRALAKEVPGAAWIEVPPSAPGRWDAVALPVPGQIYGYDLRVEMHPHRDDGPASAVESVAVETSIQHCAATLPQLKPGRNELCLRSRNKRRHRLRIELRWTERCIRRGLDRAEDWGWREPRTVVESGTPLLPVPAASLHGALAVAWQEGPRGAASRVMWTLREPGALAFGTSRNMSVSDETAAHPELAFDAEDRLVGIWQSGGHPDRTRIRMAVLDGEGPSSNPLSPTGSNRFARLVANGNGLIALWQSKDRTEFRHLERKTAGNLPGILPAGCVSPDGALHVFNRIHEMRYHEVREDEIAAPLFFDPAWTTPVGRGAIACAADGTLYALWSAHRMGDRSSILMRAKRPGLAWSRVLQLSDPVQTAARYPQVWLSGPCLHAVWMDFRDGAAAVRWKRFDGRRWSPDLLLSAPEHAAKYPRLAGYGGELHVVWQEESARGSRIRLRTLGAASS